MAAQALQMADPLVVGVLGSLLATELIAVGTRLLRGVRNRKLRRDPRGIVLRDPDGEPVAGCALLFEDTVTRRRSDRKGYISIPPTWPDRLRVTILRAGLVLLNDVDLDFSARRTYDVTIPRPPSGNGETVRSLTRPRKP